MDSLKTNIPIKYSRVRDTTFFVPHIHLVFSAPVPYVTHNAAETLSDITGGNLSDYMQLPLEPQKALYCFTAFLSHVQSC